MCWNKKAVSRSQWQKIRSRLINWAENLDRSWLEQDNLLPTRLLILLLWQPRLHGSLPMDRRLWHPEQEHFDSATGLEWVRQGVLVLYSQLPRKFQINIKRKVGVGSNAGSWEKQNRHVEEPRWSAGQRLNLAETETCASCPCPSRAKSVDPSRPKRHRLTRWLDREFQPQLADSAGSHIWPAYEMLPTLQLSLNPALPFRWKIPPPLPVTGDTPCSELK